MRSSSSRDDARWWRPTRTTVEIRALRVAKITPRPNNWTISAANDEPHGDDGIGVILPTNQHRTPTHPSGHNHHTETNFLIIIRASHLNPAAASPPHRERFIRLVGIHPSIHKLCSLIRQIWMHQKRRRLDLTTVVEYPRKVWFMEGDMDCNL